MKSLFITAAVMILSLHANAAFVCDYNYVVDDPEETTVEAIVQIEKINRQETLIIRDKDSSEGDIYGVIFGFAVTDKKQNRLGETIIDAVAEALAFDTSLKVRLRVPAVLPGEGSLTYSDGSDTYPSETVYCRHR